MNPKLIQVILKEIDLKILLSHFEYRLYLCVNCIAVISSYYIIDIYTSAMFNTIFNKTYKGNISWALKKSKS